VWTMKERIEDMIVPWKDTVQIPMGLFAEIAVRMIRAHIYHPRLILKLNLDIDRRIVRIVMEKKLGLI
jgi:hypothetical protein